MGRGSTQPAAQLPFSQVPGGAQNAPQAPQLSGLVSVSTQAPAQQVAAPAGQPVPLGHATTQAPRRQTSPDPHWPSPQHSTRQRPLQQNGWSPPHPGRQPQRFLRFLASLYGVEEATIDHAVAPAAPRPPAIDRERLRAARRARGWTQAELAERAGVCENSVARWQAMGRVPRRETWEKIAAALGLRVADLAVRSDVPASGADQ